MNKGYQEGKDLYDQFPIGIPSSNGDFVLLTKKGGTKLNMSTLSCDIVERDLVNHDSFYESKWSKLDEECMDDLSDELKEAILDVCVGISGLLLDLMDIPMKVLLKSARTLVKALPHSTKMRLIHIASEYFSNPQDVVKVTKGVQLSSDLLISTFGGIKNLLLTAITDLDRSDFIRIATNATINITLLFAGTGLVLLIKTGKKTKQIYTLSNDMQRLNYYMHRQKVILIRDEEKNEG